MNRRLIGTATALLLLGTTVACGGSDTGTDATPIQTLSAEESALYEKAKAEPQLTWYSSQDPDRNTAVIEAFQARYPGVPLTSFRLASGELANRFSQETEAGVRTAGLISVASPEFVATGRSKGWFADVTATEYPELEKFGSFFADGVVTTGINGFGIGYNTGLVSSPPTSWQDMLDPVYKGKIILGDPRNVPAYVALGTVWLQEYGEEFLKGVAAQRPTVVDSMVPGMQQLAAGEGAIGLPTVLATLNPLKAEGAPLEFMTPDVTTGVEFQTLIPDDGPSPNIAKLLYGFLLTEAGQQGFNGETSISPIGAPGTVAMPANYVTVSREQIAESESQVLTLLGIR